MGVLSGGGLDAEPGVGVLLVVGDGDDVVGDRALEELRLPALFDEIQNVPEVLNYVRVRIDRTPDARDSRITRCLHHAGLAT